MLKRSCTWLHVWFVLVCDQNNIYSNTNLYIITSDTGKCLNKCYFGHTLYNNYVQVKVTVR